MPTFDPPQWIVLAVLAASLLFFITDRLRYDVVALLVVISLAASGVLEAREAYAGFASTAVVLVASMYVFGFSVSKWGLAEELGQRLLLRGGEVGEARILVRIVLVAGLLSAVLSNAGVVAALIPVTSTVAKRTGIPVSRLLIPLSYAGLIGGMMTIIGTSKNIAVNDLYRTMTATPGVPGREFGLFEFSLFGFLLLLAVAAYFLGPGRLLLPSRRVEEDLVEHFEATRYVSELRVPAKSPIIGRALIDAGLNENDGVRVLGILREGSPDVMAPGRYNVVREGDALLLAGDTQAILRVRKELDLISAHVPAALLASSDVRLVETVVPAGSPLLGGTLKDADFAARTGLNALGISKHGHMHMTRLGRIPIEVGDSMLIQGHGPDIERMRSSRALLILDEVRTELKGRGAWVTLGLLLAVVLTAALTPLHISVCGLLGVVGLLASRAVTPNEIRGAIDWSVLILIGGMMALGKAFQDTGLAEQVATAISETSLGPYPILAVLLVVTMGLTQIMNYVAAALIMTPVALDIAARMPGDNEKALLMAVVTGASLAFMTPVAHQCNAMVMGPGDYRYRDFLKVGAPLSLLLVVLSVVLIPLFWSF
ncbi:MAG: SLC13 family permease [Planctomycetota bacterium]|nr:SLC13 family permease [Planctomycetota bacterium]